MPLSSFRLSLICVLFLCHVDHISLVSDFFRPAVPTSCSAVRYCRSVAKIKEAGGLDSQRENNPPRTPFISARTGRQSRAEARRPCRSPCNFPSVARWRGRTCRSEIYFQIIFSRQIGALNTDDGKPLKFVPRWLITVFHVS